MVIIMMMIMMNMMTMVIMMNDDNDGDDDDLSLPIFLMVSTDCMRPPSSLTCVLVVFLVLKVIYIWDTIFLYRHTVFVFFRIIDVVWYF